MICVALVPIILCFALLLPMMVSTSAKRQEKRRGRSSPGLTRQLTETFSGMERALDALAGMNGCVRRSRRATRRTLGGLCGAGRQAAKVPEMTSL
ncbi:MAG: hypothetical protein ACLUI3_14900 [Christensenellales bacterium]